MSLTEHNVYAIDDDDDYFARGETTLRAMLAVATAGAPLIACTLSDEELDREFYPGFGGDYGRGPWTAWTEERVFFPQHYDGSTRIHSAPRNPVVAA